MKMHFSFRDRLNSNLGLGKIECSFVAYTVTIGGATMVTESCKYSESTLFRTYFSGYVGHVTIFSSMLSVACVPFSS